jgi:hypothetical protein
METQDGNAVPAAWKCANQVKDRIGDMARRFQTDPQLIQLATDPVFVKGKTISGNDGDMACHCFLAREPCYSGNVGAGTQP